MELSLDLSLVYVPKTISECLREVSKVKDCSLKLSKLEDYMKRLEDEMRKIDAFKRELPLSVLLLNDAIVRLKEEAMHCKEMEIIAAKDDSCREGKRDLENDMIDKKNWMSSVQLWNNNNNNNNNNTTNNISFGSKKEDSKSETKQRSEEDDDRSTCENPVQLCNYTKRGEEFNLFAMPFKPFTGLEVTDKKEEKEVVSKVTGLSLMNTVSELGPCDLMSKIKNTNQIKVENKLQQQQQPAVCKKQRRCWSPELHRRFVDALQHLGGSQVATPKQIRELMQVDGLTNDEVKSHLQKYRLHLRKLPNSSAQANALLPMAESEHQHEPSKPGSISWSSSPRGPFHGSGSAKCTSSTGGESMEARDDDRSDSNSWNDTQ